MHLPSALLTTYAFASLAHALQLPFGWHLPWAHASNPQQIPLALSPNSEAEVDSTDHLNRVAIIGAGAGGSSAAFWIGKAKERWGLDIEVDVYESKGYVGGRSTTVFPYDDERLAPVELGASVFVEANKNMWRASDEFGFDRSGFEEGDDGMGVWDGKQFLITVSDGGISGWWGTLKMIWRYGIQAPRRAQAITNEMVKNFLNFYTASWGSTPFSNLTGLVSTLSWTELAGSTATEYFDNALGGNGKFTREIIEGATRVNYGQNVDSIHALGGTVSLAANGASQVIGGNWQVFDEFIKRSGASLHLNTTVKSITQNKANKFTLAYHFPGAASSVKPLTKAYRAVILAAPYHSSAISLNLLSAESTASEPVYAKIDDLIPPQPYVHLHVTLVSTPSKTPRTRYFGLKEEDYIPGMVLTTWQGVRDGGEDVAGPDFNSLSVHGKIKRRDTNEPANLTALGIFAEHARDDSGEEWSYKIFSDHRLEDSWLRKVFGKLGWVHKHEWDAYPYLTPSEHFPHVKLSEGMYYVNSLEPVLSTMETETLSARNIAELLLQEHFNASICKTEQLPNATKTDEPDFVYGWDC